MDGSIAKVADQEAVAKGAEIGWCQRDSPRSIQERPAIQAPNELPKGIEDRHEAEAGTMFFIVTALFAFCECDNETSADILYVEGNEVVLKVLVAESRGPVRVPAEIWHRRPRPGRS